MTPIVDHPLLRARIAAASAMRLAGKIFLDVDPVLVPAPNIWTYLRDLRTRVHATIRLVDACAAEELSDPEWIELVLVTLQHGNVRGWLQACGNDLPDFDLLIDALEAEIAYQLAQRLVPHRSTPFLDRAGDPIGDPCVADQAAQTAHRLTGGNPVLAIHLLVGAALLALREAS